MLEETLTLALILLIATHAHLIRRCTSLEGQIPLLIENATGKTVELEGTVNEVRALLDEALDMINDMPAGTPALMAQSGASESITSMILSTLLTRMGMAEADGNKTQPQQWEILQANDPTTLQTEN